MTESLKEKQENEPGKEFEFQHDLALRAEIDSLTDKIALKEGFISARMFLMGNGATMLAVVLSEDSDSFIIGMPALVAPSPNGVKVNFISPLPVTKVFKHSMSMVMLPYTKYLYAYFKSLQAQDPASKLPGYFDELRLNQLVLFIRVLEQTLKNVKVTEKQEPASSPGVMKGITLDEEGNEYESLGFAEMGGFEIKPGPGRKRTLKH